MVKCYSLLNCKTLLQVLIIKIFHRKQERGIPSSLDPGGDKSGRAGGKGRVKGGNVCDESLRGR